MNKELEIARRRADILIKIINHIAAWIVVLAVIYCVFIPIAAVCYNWSAGVLITRVLAGIFGFGFAVIILGVALVILRGLREQL